MVWDLSARNVPGERAWVAWGVFSWNDRVRDPQYRLSLLLRFAGGIRRQDKGLQRAMELVDEMSVLFAPQDHSLDYREYLVGWLQSLLTRLESELVLDPDYAWAIAKAREQPEQTFGLLSVGGVLLVPDGKLFAFRLGDIRLTSSFGRGLQEQTFVNDLRPRAPLEPMVAANVRGYCWSFPCRSLTHDDVQQYPAPREGDWVKLSRVDVLLVDPIEETEECSLLASASTLPRALEGEALSTQEEELVASAWGERERFADSLELSVRVQRGLASGKVLVMLPSTGLSLPTRVGVHWNPMRLLAGVELDSGRIVDPYFRLAYVSREAWRYSIVGDAAVQWEQVPDEGGARYGEALERGEREVEVRRVTVLSPSSRDLHRYLLRFRPAQALWSEEHWPWRLRFSRAELPFEVELQIDYVSTHLANWDSRDHRLRSRIAHSDGFIYVVSSNWELFASCDLFRPIERLVDSPTRRYFELPWIWQQLEAYEPPYTIGGESWLSPEQDPFEAWVDQFVEKWRYREL
ncbi:MAG: hypothetical protein RBU37_24015 [Myxococcota bacterium]|jgi:hypothetical protein|nr:hypothetical protein [Myxococcota bacterium]